MNFKEIEDQVDREMAAEREAHAAWKARRKLFLDQLLGGADPLTWQMPTEIDDFDALLAQHAAQLRNVVRYMMGEAAEAGEPHGGDEGEDVLDVGEDEGEDELFESPGGPDGPGEHRWTRS